MKLIGFEGHEILAMKYELITEEECDQILVGNNWAKNEKANVFRDENVEVKITKELDKTLITGEVFVVDALKYRKILITIVGQFTFDNEGETDPNKISDQVYREFWPMLQKYINPAITTITSITSVGELNIGK